MRVQCLGIVNVLPGAWYSFPQPRNGEKLEGWQFAILLGDILELKYNK